MKLEISHRCSDFDSYRAARVKSLFNVERGCDWSHTAELPDPGEDWQIGVIVGASGSGKTSIGSRYFPDAGIHDLYADWATDRPVIDAISPEGAFDDVTSSLVAVGLGDVPAWLRPFNVLSNGEKFRAGLARLICERPDHVVVDEFTSVIDRQVAKVGRRHSQRHGEREKERSSSFLVITIFWTGCNPIGCTIRGRRD